MAHPPQKLLLEPPPNCALHLLFQLISADRTLVRAVLHELRTLFPNALFGVSAQLRRLAVAPSENAFDAPDFPTLAGVPSTQTDLYVQIPLEKPPLDEAFRARLAVRGVFRVVDISAGWALSPPGSRKNGEFSWGGQKSQKSEGKCADPAGLSIPAYI